MQTHSLHAVGDREFAAAIADFCTRERVDVAHSLDELESSSPFRNSESNLVNSEQVNR